MSPPVAHAGRFLMSQLHGFWRDSNPRSCGWESDALTIRPSQPDLCIPLHTMYVPSLICIGMMYIIHTPCLATDIIRAQYPTDTQFYQGLIVQNKTRDAHYINYASYDVLLLYFRASCCSTQKIPLRSCRTATARSYFTHG